MKIVPTTLYGQKVVLETLSMAHLDSLCVVGLDKALWEWMPIQVLSKNAMREHIAAAVRGLNDGVMLPFAILDKSTKQAVGCTRFCAIDPDHQRVEIGWTWIGINWQRTAVNTETKLLMLKHAFESLRCIRVELKTDVLNERSRRAILRIGATEEGIFRKHMITESARIRDTVYYSILDTEWPSIRDGLQKRLA